MPESTPPQPPTSSTTNSQLAWIFGLMILVIAVIAIDQVMKEQHRQERCTEIAEAPYSLHPTPGSTSDEYRAAATERGRRADDIEACAG
jgi:hypothetical protein